jgi:hypothetical protein
MGSGLYYDAIWEKKEIERAELKSVGTAEGEHGNGSGSRDGDGENGENTSASTGRSPFCNFNISTDNEAAEVQNNRDIPTVEVHPPEGATWNWADLDAVPIDQSFWGMLGDRDGFVSWDNPWDIFGLNPPPIES